MLKLTNLCLEQWLKIQNDRKQTVISRWEQRAMKERMTQGYQQQEEGIKWGRAANNRSWIERERERERERESTGAEWTMRNTIVCHETRGVGVVAKYWGNILYWGEYSQL